MTAQQVLERLLELAGTQQFLERELDDDLSDVQDHLAQLIVDIANEVPGAPARIARQFPSVFGS